MTDVVGYGRVELHSREYTNRLLDMIDEGLLDRDNVILACVGYMSEAEVADMMRANEMIRHEDDEEEES